MKNRKMFTVAGKSIRDIMNIDSKTFNGLNLSEMRKVVGRLVSAGNKRLRAFDNAGEDSPATRHVKMSGGKFSTKGKNLNELRSEFVRAKNFLQSKTGSRRGWKEVKKNTISGLKKAGVEISSDEQFNDIWGAYEDLKELNPEVANRGLKYAILKDIANMTVESNENAESIALKLHENLDKIYEESVAIDNDYYGVSGFFEIE